MKLPTLSRRRSLEIKLPQNLPVSLPEKISVDLPEGLPSSLTLGRQSPPPSGGTSLLVGLAVGAIVGGAIVIALLPEPKARLQELRARFSRLDAPSEYVEDARRLMLRTKEELTDRFQRAKEEALQVQEETKRDLWRRFEVAKREGHQPPPA